jgi:succinyl-diaminopimelate desuccinylase
MSIDLELAGRLEGTVDPGRLVDTALKLCEVPSPTRDAGRVADRLAAILQADGFAVERHAADWPESPAVIARLESGRPGRTLQFGGHLDTVHLPFVPPRLEEGVLRGSGAADMKGGISASVEALRALRDAGLPQAGSILLTAHDHHEGPWGDSRQLFALIREGILGDGVLIPEYLCDRLPVAGRGLGILEIRVCRDGEPVHEVFRPADQPDVIAAGCEVVRRLKELDSRLARRPHPIAGAATVFTGRIAAGEIYNQSPAECRISGTRRWLPGEAAAEAEEELRSLLRGIAGETGTRIELDFRLQRDAFALDEGHPLVPAFQEARRMVSGAPLPVGAKPFVDDGNSITARSGIPAISHGPDARGAHTLDERVSVSELARVARTYALTALAFCPEDAGGHA